MDGGRNVVTGCPTPVAAGCLAALTPSTRNQRGSPQSANPQQHCLQISPSKTCSSKTHSRHSCSFFSAIDKLPLNCFFWPNLTGFILQRYHCFHTDVF